jgi:uncharacterized repeat protein (TIGR02543 family)
MKKIISITLIIALVITTIIYFIPSKKYADSITENDLICLAAKSAAELNEYNFVDTVSARKALNDAINYINTLDGDINTIYTNLNTEMSNLKINDSSVSIPRTNTINKTYGLNVDTLIPVINEVEEMNKISEVEYNITWITGETVSTKDLFLYMYNYGIKSIEISLNNNIEDVEKICNYANSVGMSICIDGPVNENLNKYNVFYKDGNVVDTKVEFTSDQEMINYIIYSINNNDCFYFNSASLITMSGTSNVIKAFNTVYLKYGTVSDSYNVASNLNIKVVEKNTEAEVKIESNKKALAKNTETEVKIKSNKKDLANNIDANTTLYHNIKYKLSGGINNKKNPALVKHNTVIKLYNPTRKGYIFKGWYIGDKKVTSIKITNNKTVTAKWTKIKLSKAKVTSTKRNKNNIKINIKKSKGVSGYQIQVSTSKSFKNAKNYTTTSPYKTIKINKNKTYYIRVRYYKIDSTNKRVYGKWSNISKK